ncbi:MAG: GIY-YIG nuclease family protein [Candidatus Puniceispirillaceae bacterium]
MPIVYILTNEAMPGLVKIGIAEDNKLKEEMDQLDTKGVPLPFECFYAVKVPNAGAVERSIHQGLSECRIRDGREFFQTTPDQAKALLSMAEAMGGVDVTPQGQVVMAPQDKKAQVTRRKRRLPFRFSMVGIQPGEKLQFKEDSTIECEVINDRQVLFRGQITTLSGSAHTILKEMGFDWVTQGPAWWCYQGQTLYGLRLQMED